MTEYISKVQDEGTGKIAYFKDSKAREDIETLSSQYKDIANYSLIKHTDGKIYIKKQDGTLLGDGIEIGGSDVDLSKITMSVDGQTLKLLNNGIQIATVVLPKNNNEIPSNVVLFQDDDSTETTEDYIPLLSSNGTEYRLTINDNGVPIVKDSSNNVVFTCGTGGSSGGGGDTPITPDTPEKVTSGTPYPSLNFTQGKYINKTNGQEENDETWYASDYISVIGIDYIKTSKLGRAIEYNAFYDVNKNFISNFITGSTIYIDVPDNACYFRVSAPSSNLTITPFTSPSQTWTNGVTYDLKLIANKYIKQDGTISDYNGWSMTDYLECFGASKLTITGNTIQTSYCVFFDQAKEKIKDFVIKAESPYEVPIYSHACYVVISNKTDVMNAITVTPTV